MSEDTEGRCTGFEVGNGDYIVCDPNDSHAWIRSDTVVELDAAELEPSPQSR